MVCLLDRPPRCKRQSGLAAAARPDQCDQRRCQQQINDLSQQRLSADEAGGLSGKCASVRGYARQRRAGSPACAQYSRNGVQSAPVLTEVLATPDRQFFTDALD